MALGKKGEAQRLRVIESATYCLTHFGERGTTFQAISEHCKISQASVVKYLKSRDNIFPSVLEYWISRARVLTEDSLLKAGSPEEKLRNYIQVSISIFSEREEVAKLYVMLHYFASINERYRVVNSQIKDVARARIAEIIKAGIADGSFKPVDVPAISKTIHNSLFGFLMSTVTELSRPSDLHLPTTLENSSLELVLK